MRLYCMSCRDDERRERSSGRIDLSGCPLDAAGRRIEHEVAPDELAGLCAYHMAVSRARRDRTLQDPNMQAALAYLEQYRGERISRDWGEEFRPSHMRPRR
jgi:hypothetical protein